MDSNYRIYFQSHEQPNSLRYIMFAPIRMFVTLQQIGVVPARYLLPSPQFLSRAFISSLLIPPIPATWNIMELVMSLVSSPLFHLATLDYLVNAVDGILTQYAGVLPKPSNREENSMNHKRGQIIPAEAQEDGSLAFEIYKEARNLVENFASFPRAYMRYFMNVVSLIETFRSTDAEIVHVDTNTAVNLVSEEIDHVQSIAIPTPVSSSFEVDYHYEDDDYDEDRLVTENPIRNGRVQITTRRGSAEDTHEMNIEWNLNRRNMLDSLGNIANDTQPMREAVQNNVYGTPLHSEQ